MFRVEGLGKKIRCILRRDTVGVDRTCENIINVTGGVPDNYEVED